MLSSIPPTSPSIVVFGDIKIDNWTLMNSPIRRVIEYFGFDHAKWIEMIHFRRIQFVLCV